MKLFASAAPGLWRTIFVLLLLFLFPSAMYLPDSHAAGTQSSPATRAIVIKPQGSEGSSQEIQLYKESHALLIGESNYTAGWPDLESVPAELSRVEKVLQQQGFSVEKHLDLKGDELALAFEKFIGKHGYQKENRLLFLYAGHGHTRQDGEKGYLVPVDAPNPERDEQGFLGKALGMNKVLAWSRDMEAKHALFLFDSCFSGTIFKQRDLPAQPPHISTATALPVRQFITAGSAGETVPASSVFVPAFVDALEYGWGDLNRDGYVSGTELGLYLQEKVPSHAGQTPQYGKITDYDLSRGDFIFLASGSMVRDTAQDAAGASSAPEPDSGSLQVTTSPEGAGLWLDGVSKGIAPLQLEKLKAGSMKVRSEKAGYQPREETVLIRDGRKTELKIVLDKIVTTGSIRIESGPSGAKWYLDDAYVGTTPDTLGDVAQGSHRLTVKKDGYEDWTQQIEVAPGKQADAQARLVEIPRPVAAAPGGVFSVANNFRTGPSVMTLKTAQAKKPAQFPHAKHQEMLKKCDECHHTMTVDGRQGPYEAGKEAKCESCHDGGKTIKNPKVDSFMKAAHQNCKGCHKAKNKGPDRCDGCHTKYRGR